MTPTEPSESKDATKRSLASRFRQLTFWNKLATIGSIASVISIPMSIYLYFASIQTRDLMYRPFWDTWVVHKPEPSSKFSLVYAGQSLEDDVFLKQIAIWNEGRQPIRPENILAPVVVVVDPSSRILDASIVDVTRDVVHFKIDNTNLDSGRIPVSWDMLEHKDGALLQIVCVQKSLSPYSFTVEGTIEGQKTLRRAMWTHFGDSLLMEITTLVYNSLMLLCGTTVFAFACSDRGRADRKRLVLTSIVMLAGPTFFGWVAFNAVFDWPPFSMR